MLPSSSSTSNSKVSRSRHGLAQTRLRRRAFSIILWTLTASIAIDAVVGLVFRLPADVRNQGSALQNYFDYGRSIEGKLRRLVGRTSAGDAPIVGAGWLLHECDEERTLPPDKSGFDMYGMSFTSKIADQMERLDPGIAIRRFGGPGAPPNHSYACFLRRFEANRALAPVQILGVLASSVRRMETISGLTTSFEGPAPFTYPRYSLAKSGKLEGHMPAIMSEDDLRSSLADPQKWREFEADLAANDYFYSRSTFKSDFFDYSVMARMIRRAWGQRVVNDRTSALRPTEEFSGGPDIIPVLRAILIDFARKARERGTRPFVILIEDRGYGGTVSAPTTPTLASNGIEFISTSTIVAPSDSSNFVADGHFTSTAFATIAQAVLTSVGRAPATASSGQ
jgi:hypothetical protein